MKTKEEIEQLAKEEIERYRISTSSIDKPKEIQRFNGFIKGYTQCQKDIADKKYTEEDMINASKYGYEFRDTTSFPEHKFEDSCINNTKQWLEWYNNKQE